MGERERYTAKQFIDAIPGTMGIIRDVARRVGCTWLTARRYIERYPTVRRAYENERNQALDIAETALHEAVRGGEPWAIKFFLSTKGKGRGYTKRQELVGVKGAEGVAAPLTIIFSLHTR